jgi:cobalt-zinc-cadmium efflux system outer membrane protein
LLLASHTALTQDKEPPSELGEETSTPNPEECISFDDALNITLERNPELAGMALEIDAAQARQRQAGLWPNPVLGVESENFSGDNPGFNFSENTVTITQPFVTGSKINLRKEAAGKERSIAELKFQIKKREIIAEAEKAYYGILVAQKHLEFARQGKEIARELFEFIGDRSAREGFISPTETLRAKVELSQAELDVDKAEQELELAKKKLTSLWGDTEAPLGKCLGTLEREFLPFDYDTVRDQLYDANPEMALLNVVSEKVGLDVKAARAERIPDVDLGFGVRQFEEDDTYTFVLAVDVPLPLFDRNQGGIAEAKVNQRKTISEAETLENDLLLKLNEAYRGFQLAHQEANTFRTDILPRAEEYLKVARQGYEAGDYEYLEVLEAQKTRVDVNHQYIDALSNLHAAIAELERLTATILHREPGGKIPPLS